MSWDLLKSNCKGQVLKAWSLATLSQRPSADTNLKGWGFAFPAVSPLGMVLTTLFNIYSHTLIKPYCQMTMAREYLWTIDSKRVHFSITFIFIRMYT